MLGRGTLHVQSRKRRERVVVMYSSVSRRPALLPMEKNRNTRACRARDHRRENLATTSRPAAAIDEHQQPLDPSLDHPETYIYVQVDESLRLPPIRSPCAAAAVPSRRPAKPASTRSARAREPPLLDWIRPPLELAGRPRLLAHSRRG